MFLIFPQENTLKPEVPEVSLMFENGFQNNKTNEASKQVLLERAIKNSMKMTPEAVQDREINSPGPSNPTEYNINELLQKNSKLCLTPNKPKSKPSTPNRCSKLDKADTAKSSSDEMDLEKQTHGDNNRHINTESHLIEPVESYSVWKYKNQHMFVKENEQAIHQKKTRHHDSSEFINQGLGSSQPAFRINHDQQQQASQKEVRHYYSPEFRNPDLGSNKSHYRTNHDQQEQDVGIRHLQKPPFDQDPSNHRMGLSKYPQEHINPNVEYYKRNAYRSDEDHLPSQKFTGKSNWRNPTMNFDTPEPVARYIEAMPYQRDTTNINNSVSELCKIVEFQTKHIEFLNEQIYTLTLQNKTLSNLTKHVKTLEDTQIQQSEEMKKNFNQLQEIILNGIKENNTPLSNKRSNKIEDNIEDHLDRMEKKLIDLINSKMNVNNEPKNIQCVTGNQNEDENETSSSSEDPVPVNSKQNTSKQCMCACNSSKQCTKYKKNKVLNKANQKSPGIKTDHRNNAKHHVEQQADVLKYNLPVAKEWECQPGHSKQTSYKKSNKKSQRKPDQIEKLVMNPPMAQPVVYYQHMYEADKFASNNQRVSQGQKLKKDKNKSSPEEKSSAAQTKKTIKTKSQHFAKSNYRQVK